MKPSEPLWTVYDLARHLGIEYGEDCKRERNRLLMFVYRHKIPRVRMGGRVRFDPADVRAWVKSRRVD